MSMTLFRWVHGSFQLTGWGALWLIVATGMASATTVIHR